MLLIKLKHQIYNIVIDNKSFPENILVEIPDKMAKKTLISTFVLCILVTSSLQEVSDNKIDSQEESPLASIANEILREKNLENIGGVVSNHYSARLKLF